MMRSFRACKVEQRQLGTYVTLKTTRSRNHVLAACIKLLRLSISDYERVALSLATSHYSGRRERQALASPKVQFASRVTRRDESVGLAGRGQNRGLTPHAAAVTFSRRSIESIFYPPPPHGLMDHGIRLLQLKTWIQETHGSTRLFKIFGPRPSRRVLICWAFVSRKLKWLVNETGTSQDVSTHSYRRSFSHCETY